MRVPPTYPVTEPVVHVLVHVHASQLLHLAAPMSQAALLQGERTMHVLWQEEHCVNRSPVSTVRPRGVISCILLLLCVAGDTAEGAPG
jgi:hypothetical protein